MYIILSALLLSILIYNYFHSKKSKEKAGEIIMKLEEESKGFKVFRTILFIIALTYLLYRIFNDINMGNIINDFDIDMFLAVYIIFFSRVYGREGMLTENGVLRYSTFVPYQNIDSYTIDKINNKGKYRIKFNYKRSKDKFRKKLYINTKKESKDIKKVLRKHKV